WSEVDCCRSVAARVRWRSSCSRSTRAASALLRVTVMESTTRFLSLRAVLVRADPAAPQPARSCGAPAPPGMRSCGGLAGHVAPVLHAHHEPLAGERGEFLARPLRGDRQRGREGGPCLRLT